MIDLAAAASWEADQLHPGNALWSRRADSFSRLTKQGDLRRAKDLPTKKLLLWFWRSVVLWLCGSVALCYVWSA